MFNRKINSKKKIIGILLVTLLLAGGLLWLLFRPETEDYGLSRDMAIYFSNGNELVGQLREAMERHDTKITLSYQANAENMEIISSLVAELMEAALQETKDPKQGDYIRYQYGGYVLSYGHSSEGEGYRYSVSIEPKYYTDLEQEQEVDARVREILEEMHFHFWTTDYEKVRAIYDYIYDNVQYDEVHRNKDGYHLKTTAYAALIYNRAICQGYAVATQRLLLEAGINCRIVTGMVDNDGNAEYHAWNLVELDGRYYNLDIMWDQLLDTEDYFLKTDEAFAGYHRDEEFSTAEFYEQYPMATEDYMAE